MTYLTEIKPFWLDFVEHFYNSNKFKLSCTEPLERGVDQVFQISFNNVHCSAVHKINKNDKVLRKCQGTLSVRSGKQQSLIYSQLFVMLITI